MILMAGGNLAPLSSTAANDAHQSTKQTTASKTKAKQMKKPPVKGNESTSRAVMTAESL